MTMLSVRRVLALTVLLAAGSGSAWATITVSPMPEQFPDVIIGQTFHQQFYANTQGVTWSIIQGLLPPGTTLDASTGLISGQVTSNGFYVFVLQAATTTDSGSATYEVNVQGGPLTINPSSFNPRAADGTAYSAQLAGYGGAPPYTWSLATTTGTNGLSLSRTGLLAGTPLTTGYTILVVTLTDSRGTTVTGPLGLNVIGITTTTLPPAALGAVYSQTLGVAGAQVPAAWSWSGALPPGFTLSSQGVLAGYATTSGTYTFTVTVTDWIQNTASASLTLVVGGAPGSSGLTITTSATLPAATASIPYSATLAASGGKAPYTWALTSGTLPAGLTLSTAGAITGMPAATGTSSFTIGVTDSAQAFATQAFTLTVLQSTLDFTSALRIPQVADGGNFITEFAIVNLDAAPVSYQFRFWGDDGSPLNLPIQDGVPGTLAGTLSPGAIAFAQTTGASAPATAAALQGWAEAAATGRIGVAAIFKRSVPGASDSEATVRAATSSGAISLPFDNAQGYATGLAVANSNPLQAITVTAVFEFENGGSYPTSFALQPHAHTTFVLPVAFSATAGLRGVVHLTSFSPDISAVGLRFSPNNSFTSLGSFE